MFFISFYASFQAAVCDTIGVISGVQRKDSSDLLKKQGVTPAQSSAAQLEGLVLGPVGTAPEGFL